MRFKPRKYISKNVLWYLYERQDKKCYWCYKLLKVDEVEIDHRIPRTFTQSDAACELVGSCQSCNSRRNSHLWATDGDCRKWLQENPGKGASRMLWDETIPDAVQVREEPENWAARPLEPLPPYRKAWFKSDPYIKM